MFHLLVQKHMEPVPNCIDIVNTFGEIDIVNEGKIISGKHMMIVGDMEKVREWLLPFGEIWRGKGEPFEQEFELVRVRLPAEE